MLVGQRDKVAYRFFVLSVVDVFLKDVAVAYVDVSDVEQYRLAASGSLIFAVGVNRIGEFGSERIDFDIVSVLERRYGVHRRGIGKVYVFYDYLYVSVIYGVYLIRVLVIGSYFILISDIHGGFDGGTRTAYESRLVENYYFPVVVLAYGVIFGLEFNSSVVCRFRQFENVFLPFVIVTADCSVDVPFKNDFVDVTRLACDIFAYGKRFFSCVNIGMSRSKEHSAYYLLAVTGIISGV